MQIENPRAIIHGDVVAHDVQIILELLDPEAGGVRRHAIVLDVATGFNSLSGIQVGNVNSARAGLAGIHQVVADVNVAVEIPNLNSPGRKSIDAIMTGGNTIAGVGVSGAPGGNFDEECARAAIAKIQDRMK